MTTPSPRTTRRKPASSPTSGPQAQARTHRQAYNRRKTRAKAKSEALGQKEAAQVEALPVLHPHAAGIDIGSRSHWVCVGFTSETASCLIQEFPAHTDGLKAIAAFLREHQVTTIAMESTGIYWIALYELLESEGFEVLLVDPSYTGRFPSCIDLYINMLDMQLTYDALRILNFDSDTLEAMAHEMAFVRYLAHAGKLAQARLIAHK